MRARVLAWSVGLGGVSLQDPKSSGAAPRSSKLHTVGNLLAGVAIVVAGGTFIGFDLTKGSHAMTVLGLSISNRTVAAAVIVMGMTLIGRNLRGVLKLVDSNREALSARASPGSPEISRSASAQTGSLPAPSSSFCKSERLVGLQLLEPEPERPSSEMELTEAVRCAFRETQATAAAVFATAVAVGSDDVVKMYATFIAEHVPIYGRRPPSGDRERVSLKPPFTEFAIEDGSLVLRQPDGSGTYRGLTIAAGDYGFVVERLRASTWRRNASLL